MANNNADTGGAGSQSGTPVRYFTVVDNEILIQPRLDDLKKYQPRLKADMVGLAQMVAASGPIGGRTIYENLYRLQPGQRIKLEKGRLVSSSDWEWENIPATQHEPNQILDALTTEVQRVTRQRNVISMLSGGWDSRLLLALTKLRSTPRLVRALTTSSDTGTVMEELVATQAAALLDVDHDIIFPRRDSFGEDFSLFVKAVEFQTNFHVWLVPLVKKIADGQNGFSDFEEPIVLDGLGGGLFVGGAFADPEGGLPLSQRRLEGIVKYLTRAERVVKPEVAEHLREAIVSDAEPIINRYLDHPYGNILAAYLIRTLPGISMAPHGLVSQVAQPATPFVSSAVVEAGLSLQPALHKDDRLYPVLLRKVSPGLANLSTAQEQVPWPRPHPRRIASIEAIKFLRSLVLSEPTVHLLSPALIEAGPQYWRRLLTQTSSQHLLRGLATLTLWWREHRDFIDGFDIGQWLK